jgi:hypothetical protein
VLHDNAAKLYGLKSTAERRVAVLSRNLPLIYRARSTVRAGNLKPSEAPPVHMKTKTSISSTIRSGELTVAYQSLAATRRGAQGGS